MEKITEYIISSTIFKKNSVRAWNEKISIPTYAIGKEEKNPIFLEKRVYQASSGSVYPYPVVEKISDHKEDKEYNAFFIENYYIKVMILPELGGRIQMAYDKIRKRHFVYYNQVIKPALVGLTGPWISGGIEFNWPQHHRPSTFLPTDAKIEENPDGSVTVWCNEIERMNRTKGAQGFTLYPDKAYIEINVKLYNRTPFPQTFLWWANPAVVVNDKYYSVFPPDVNAVFDHGKRAVTAFPISKSVYYKYNYAPGTDISRYKNIPVPTSYMAVLSKYDIIGGYDEGAEAGLLHVADHHVSSGKKQWTWGNGEFGQAWDRNLTDEDGPYIELMTGVYCDNQPDFSWLQPYEEKSWKQYFMPYAQAGLVKQATVDIVLNFTKKDGEAKLILYATSEFENAPINIYDQDQRLVWSTRTDLSPESPFSANIKVSDDTLYHIEVMDSNGKIILKYQEETLKDLNLIPEPAKPARLPEEITSIEQLFLTGLHLEQYHHATYEPMDYYNEALKREPGDVRCNNAKGLLLLRKGEFQSAELHFRKAIKTLQERNPNPYDGEPFYNLGLSLKWQRRIDEAYDAFYKATWNAAWQSAGYFAIAQIDSMRKDYEKALQHINQSLVMNWHNHKARQLKASILRKMGRKQECEELIEDSLEIDTFNMGIRLEKYFLTGEKKVTDDFKQYIRGTVHDYIEYAIDFSDAGMFEEAIEILNLYTESTDKAYPIAIYAKGYYLERMGRFEEAISMYKKGETCCPDYCFPNRVEEVILLDSVIESGILCPKAHYYLGNFMYAKKNYKKAISLWEKSYQLDGNYPTVIRNLALAYYNKLHLPEKAIKMMEKAFEEDRTDSRVYMELDQLYKKLNYSYEFRLEFHKKYMSLVEERDDEFIEHIQLLNETGRFEEALKLTRCRQFHPWEGGEGLVARQFTFSILNMATKAIKEKNWTRALELLKMTDHYPYNFGEGKLATIEEHNVDYYKAIAFKALGQRKEADEHFAKATSGRDELERAVYYYDTDPSQVYYKGLALADMGAGERAEQLFKALVDYGKEHLDDRCRINYFAVSLPELTIWDMDLNLKNRAHCHYLMGLGYLGLKVYDKAKYNLEESHKLDINNQEVLYHLNICKELL